MTTPTPPPLLTLLVSLIRFLPARPPLPTCSSPCPAPSSYPFLLRPLAFPPVPSMVCSPWTDSLLALLPALSLFFFTFPLTDFQLALLSVTMLHLFCGMCNWGSSQTSFLTSFMGIDPSPGLQHFFGRTRKYMVHLGRARALRGKHGAAHGTTANHFQVGCDERLEANGKGGKGGGESEGNEGRAGEGRNVFWPDRGVTSELGKLRSECKVRG